MSSLLNDRTSVAKSLWSTAVASAFLGWILLLVDLGGTLQVSKFAEVLFELSVILWGISLLYHFVHFQEVDTAECGAAIIRLLLISAWLGFLPISLPLLTSYPLWITLALILWTILCPLVLRPRL